MKGIQDGVAVVTGAGSGIRRQSALRFAEGGASVVAADVVEEALDRYGGLDFAHNNAGVEGDTDPLADGDEENWDAVIDVNLKGVWRCMKREIPEMVDGGGGTIVNTASIRG